LLQTLFHIPLTMFGLPVFGFGLLLALWVVFSLIWLGYLVRQYGFTTEIASTLPWMILFGAAIAFLSERLCDAEGLPIRGYGMMLLVAVVSGLAMAHRRAVQVGLNPEVIASLAFWLFISGLVGARLFYVIEYWKEFYRGDVKETIVHILSFTQGGLVVFGSAIGAGLALVIFCRRHKLPVLALSDCIAPSLMLGLALGRVGCFLNGCCYGGTCDLPWKVQFPPTAPAYQDQAASGKLFGLKFTSQPAATPGHESVPVVDAVEPDSWVAPLKPGETIDTVNGQSIDSVKELRHELTSAAVDNDALRITAGDSMAATDGPGQLPQKSLPIHPAQLYAAIDAGLLFLLLWFFFPFRRHDGEVTALMLMLHPISRFLLEVIRIDESAIFGTGMSISQNLSLLMFAMGAGLWFYLSKQPRHLAWPVMAPQSTPV
jgi:phosphatidylglycerol:prolipoprotein diacylglycerol transferase